MIDLSSDASEGFPENTLGELDMKSELIFDEYERLGRDRIRPAAIATYMATNFLSPNGYLAYTCNSDVFKQSQ